MKPVFFINTSSHFDFGEKKENFEQLPIFIYKTKGFDSTLFGNKIKSLYGLNPKYTDLSTKISIIIVDDNSFSSKNILEKIKNFEESNFRRISEIIYLHTINSGLIDDFNDFLTIRSERRKIFSKEVIPTYDFCFSRDIYNSEETILEFENIIPGFINFIKFFSQNYNNFIRGLDNSIDKIYSIGNANLSIPHEFLKEIAINQLEQLIYFDFINAQYLTKENYNNFIEKVKKELIPENITNELVADFEFQNRNLGLGVNIHPKAYDILNKILPVTEIPALLPEVSSNNFLELYYRQNQDINKLFKTLDYPNVREESLQNDLNEQFTSFQGTVDKIFDDFKNRDLLEIEEGFINRTKEKERSFKSDIEQTISELLSLKKDAVKSQFGDTTSIEACIGVIDYIIQGKSDYVIEAETESFDLYHIERIIADYTAGGNTEYERHQKKIVEHGNLIDELTNIVNSVETNDKETVQNYSTTKNLESELTFGFKKQKNQNKSLFNITKLTRIVFITIFSILLLIALGIWINDSNINYYVLSITLPTLAGSLSLFLLIKKFKQAKKKYKSSIEIKKSLYIRYIRSYERYITNILNIVREGYKYRLLKSLHNYLNFKIYELNVFRRYLIYQFSKNLMHIKSELDFTGNPFDISPISFENYFNCVNTENYNTTENNLKPFLNLLFENFTSNNQTPENGFLHPKKFQIGLFDEIDANEIVKPLPEHKDQNYEKLSENDNDIILFIKAENSKSKVEIDDIKQGEIGNCYFMSAIGAIANSNPELIENMIFKNSNNTYTIKFYNENIVESFITLDDKFWQDENNIPIYAQIGNQDGDKKEIWPMLLEKAWAKINNGYANIIGDSKNFKIDYGLALTGMFSDYKSINEDIDLNEIEKIFKDHFNDNKLPITLTSLNEDCKREGEAPGLIKNHAYALKEYNSNKKTVSIFNPHGNNHFNNVPIDFIKRNFQGIHLFKFKNKHWKFNISPFQKLEIFSKVNLRCPENEYVYKKTENFIQNISFKTVKLSDEQLNHLAKRIVNLSSPWISKNLINQLVYDNKITNPKQFIFLSEETGIKEFDDQLNHNIVGDVQNNRIKTSADFEIVSLMAINLVLKD